MASVEFVVEGNDQKLTVKVIGEIVADTCNELRETVIELSGRKPAQIILDFAQLSFIDTSGLGVLVGLRTHLKARGVTIGLANLQPRVKHVFQLTQISKLFGIES